MDKLKRDIASVRDLICNWTLIIAGILALPALAASLYRITSIGWQPLMALQIVLVALVWLLIGLRKKITYKVRAGFILLIMILAGGGGLWQFGLLAGAIPVLVAMPAMATVFFGSRSGILAGVGAFLFVAAAGIYTVHTGRLPVSDLAAYLTSPVAWAAFIFAFAVAVGVLHVATDLSNRFLIAGLDEKVRLLLEHTQDGICGLDGQGRITFANQAAAGLLGYDPKSLMGSSLHEVFRPSAPDGGDLSPEESPFYGCLAKGEYHSLHGALLRRVDGTSFPVEYSCTAIRDKGQAVGAVLAFRDITERKSAEDALRVSESRLAQAQAIAHLGHWTWDIASGGLAWSDETYRIFDRDPSRFEATYENFMSVVHPDDREAVVQAVEQAVYRRRPYRIEHRAVRENGEIRVVEELGEVVCDAGGAPRRMLGTVLDITERKKAEDALRISERKYRNLVESANDAIFAIDSEGVVLFLNHIAAHQLGGKPEDYSGRNIREIFPPELAEKHLAGVRAIITSRQGFINEGITELRGEKRWFRTNGQPLPDDSGAVFAAMFIGTDITERKRIEKALQESEEKYKLLADHSADVIYKFRLPDGQFTYASPASEKMIGYTADEVISLNTRDLFTEASHETGRNWMMEALARGDHSPAILELEVTRKDGSLLPVEIHASFLMGESGNPEEVLGVARDIGKRKADEARIQAALREKEVLLREIHHRVKNNMAVMSSLLNLQANQEDEPRVREILSQSRHRLKAMALIHETLYQSDNLSQVHLDDYIRHLMDNVVTLFSTYRVSVDFEVLAEGIKLGVNQAVPCGIIVNELVTNALKYAFPNGQSGKVSITARQTPEQMIELVIADNGVGLPRGLDPRRCKSLGLRLLGLMTEQLHGTWEVSNGHGTVFTIRWPLEGETPQTASPGE